MDQRVGAWKGRQGFRNQTEGRWGVPPRYPLAGFMLDAEEVIMRITVSSREVLGFYRSLPVPHHYVEDGDRTTESR